MARRCLLWFTVLYVALASFGAVAQENVNLDDDDAAEDAEVDESADLPTPSGLESDVKFWEQIFLKYDKDQCVLHDKWNLKIIYGVASIPTGNQKYRQKLADRYKAEISRILQTFAGGAQARTNYERQVWAAIPQYLQTPAFFDDASQNVRCQQGVASNFRSSLQRSTQYLPMIKKILRQKSLPEELAYLPHLESGFNNKAYSKVVARGLWQLMPATARQGMRVNRRQDQRVTPTVATDFATNMLLNNFRKAKSWPLALTGYNYGINGVMRATKALGTSDFMDIRSKYSSRTFGFAARNFYASFLAVRNIARRHEQEASASVKTQL